MTCACCLTSGTVAATTTALLSTTALPWLCDLRQSLQTSAASCILFVGNSMIVFSLAQCVASTSDGGDITSWESSISSYSCFSERALLPLLREDVLMLNSPKSVPRLARRLQFGHNREAAQVAQTTISFACEAACKPSPRHEQENRSVAGWLHCKHGF